MQAPRKPPFSARPYHSTPIIAARRGMRGIEVLTNKLLDFAGGIGSLMRVTAHAS